jgi:hypothetical protein
VLAAAASAKAQPVPLTLTCNTASGRAVAAVQITSGTIARAALDQDGRAVVRYDPRRIDGVTPQDQLFVFAHECGHHALGHDARAPMTAVQEQEADCYAIRSLISRAGFTRSDVATLTTEMTGLEAGIARHLPWRARVYDLEGCLPDVAAQRQAAARGSGEIGAEQCVVHNDGENAIETKTRDGRIIGGMYAVGNACARDVACTFTIEVGTLLESDIDVGSWRSFRVQGTITEQHVLKPGPRGSAAKVEFRFRGAVDTVAPGEAVDFRVRPTCQY